MTVQLIERSSKLASKEICSSWCIYIIWVYTYVYKVAGYQLCDNEHAVHTIFTIFRDSFYVAYMSCKPITMLAAEEQKNDCKCGAKERFPKN